MGDRGPAEKVARNIRRKMRKQRSSEEKIRVVISGLRGEESVAPPLTQYTKADEVVAALTGLSREGELHSLQGRKIPFIISTVRPR